MAADDFVIRPYEFKRGPQLFMAQDGRGNKQYFRVTVRRETPEEQRARQEAFASDKAYIEDNLVPGKPVYAKQITLGG